MQIFGVDLELFSAGLGFSSGILGGALLNGLYERTSPPVRLKSQVSVIDFGYSKIELEPWNKNLSAEEFITLSRDYTPRDSVDVSKRFAKSFNNAVRASGIIDSLAPRRYSGKDFFDIVANGLGFFGRNGALLEVVDSLISELDEIPNGDESKFLNFLNSSVRDYKMFPAIVNSGIASIQRKDISMSREPYSELEDRSFGYFTEEKENDGKLEYRLRFAQWSLPFGINFGEPEKTKEIVSEFCVAINKADSEYLREFLDLVRKRISVERDMLIEIVEMSNDYLTTLIPTTIRCSVLFFNAGRFDASVDPQGTLRVFRKKPILKKYAMPDFSVEMKVLSDDPIDFVVPAGSLRRMNFEASLESSLAKELMSVYRAKGCTASFFASTLHQRGRSKFSSPLLAFQRGQRSR